jgi:enamine deaminase RidA (YjgF/YER057c/UK114 family)
LSEQPLPPARRTRESALSLYRLDQNRPDPRPARSAFGASGLALGALIELECQAYAGKR